VRYVSIGEVNQSRLQVFSQDGAQVYDSEFHLGNLIEWTLSDQQGRHLADGSYLFLVTVKDFAGALTQKYGTALLEQGQVSLSQIGLDELPQAQSVALQANKLAANLSTVDRVGAMGMSTSTVSTSTVDTKPSKPEPVTVAPEIPRLTAGGENISGAGTQNQVAKWIDNSGALGNSAITEVGGNVGIGTSTPNQVLEIKRNQEGITGLRLTNSTASPYSFTSYQFQNDTGILGGFFANSFANTQYAGRNSINLVNAAPAALGFGTNDTIRMFISGGGSVGIGTMTPAAGTKLDVAGNVKISGNGNGIMFPDGTSQTTAHAGPLRIIDSTGKEVGLYDGGATYIPLSNSDEWVYLYPTKQGFVPEFFFYFTTTDCTGTRYLYKENYYFTQRAFVYGGALYYPDGPAQIRQIRSQSYLNGNNIQCDQHPVDVSVSPAASFSISDLWTPPFRLAR
jgi:hypothetical protein